MTGAKPSDAKLHNSCCSAPHAPALLLSLGLGLKHSSSIWTLKRPPSTTWAVHKSLLHLYPAEWYVNPCEHANFCFTHARWVHPSETPPLYVTQAEDTNFILDSIHTPPTHTTFILDSILRAVLHMHKHSNLIPDSILHDMLHMWVYVCIHACTHTHTHTLSLTAFPVLCCTHLMSSSLRATSLPCSHFSSVVQALSMSWISLPSGGWYIFCPLAFRRAWMLKYWASMLPRSRYLNTGNTQLQWVDPSVNVLALDYVCHLKEHPLVVTTIAW